MINQTELQQLIQNNITRVNDSMFAPAVLASVSNTISKLAHDNPELYKAATDAAARGALVTFCAVLLEKPLTNYMRARGFREKSIANTVMVLKSATSVLAWELEGKLAYNLINVGAYNVIFLAACEYNRRVERYSPIRDQLIHYKASIITTIATMIIKGQLDARLIATEAFQRGVDRILIALTSASTSGVATAAVHLAGRLSEKLSNGMTSSANCLYGFYSRCPSVGSIRLPSVTQLRRASTVVYDNAHELVELIPRRTG